MNLIKEFKENRRYYYGLFSIIFIIICCIIGTLIGNRQTAKLNAFTSQLTEHAVPESSRVANVTTGTNKVSGHTESYACLILQSTLSKEELLSFYDHDGYQPAREGNVVTLQVLPLSEDHLATLKTTNYYEEEGGDYWYIYLYSANPTD